MPKSENDSDSIIYTKDYQALFYFIHTVRKSRYYYHSHFIGKSIEIIKEVRDHPNGREYSSGLTKK